MSKAYQLDLESAFVPWDESAVTDRRSGGRTMRDRSGYVEELTDARGRSGVYAILDEHGRRVLYVGESHTGRLFETITRHFRAWTRPVERDGRRFGGTMYDRERVLVAWIETAPEDAAVQYANIQALRPRDNTIDGGGAVSAVELPV